MKHTLKEPIILNEGYILYEGFELNEGNILDERLVLTEETPAEFITNNLKVVLKRVNAIADKVAKLPTTDVDTSKFNTELDDLVDQAQLTADPTIAKAKGQEYINNLTNILGKNVNINNYPNLKKAIDDVKKYTDAATINANQKNALINRLKSLNSQVDQAFNSFTSEQVDKSSATKSLENTKELINKLINSANRIVRDNKTAIRLNNILKDFMNGLPTANKVSGQTLRDIVRKNREFVGNPVFSNFTAELAGEKSEKLDWAEVYKSCRSEEDFRHFWLGNPNAHDANLKLGYYKAEWGDNADFVKDELDGPFVEECEKAGFNSITNPFIYFLKSQNRINTFSISKARWITLHNAVAERTIVEKDLFGKGKLGMDNIVFYKNLWEEDAADMADYIELQNRIMSEMYNFSDDVQKAYNANPAAFVKNILLADGNLAELNNAEILRKDSNFRSITAIEQEITKLLGGKEEKKTINTDQLMDRLENIDKDTAKGMLKYVIDYFTDKFNSQVNSFISGIRNYMKELDKVNPTYEDKLRYSDRLKLNSTQWSGSLVTILLNTLAVIAEYKTK